jgi:hypothetical protein
MALDFTVDNYLTAAKQLISLVKTTSRTTVAAMPFSLFDIAGNPGAGTLAVGNTANGIVPTPASVAGYPSITAFGAGNAGYLTRVQWGSTVASRLALYDRLFSAGAYNFNDTVTLGSQPSYTSRLPDGVCTGRTQIWIEFVTAFTGILNIDVQYTNCAGATGKSTGVVATVAGTVGRMWQLPLAAGDSGVSVIEKVTATVASAGTFNVHVMRPLWIGGRIPSVGAGGSHNFIDTGRPVVYANTCLFPVVTADSTASGIPEMLIEIANM